MEQAATRSTQIKLLPDHLINQIAAGEVIERPASVVKELLDNSLDAAASVISVDIEKGGVGLIRVRDNGIGIHHDDLQLALTRHATSKISNLDDLREILTMGFRGEALPSIASISRTTMMSAYQNEEHAWMVKGEGRSEALIVEPVSHPNGTTIEVRDLFFNVPARRKFLRMERTEFYQIQQLVRHFAVSHPEVSVRLTHNGRHVFNFKAAPESDGASRVREICGAKFIQHAIKIDAQVEGLHLTGWVGKPEVAKTMNDTQFFCLNGRCIRDKRVNHAIQQAFQDCLPAGRYAVYVLYLRMEPTMVDVNVHPAKTEVRFREGRGVHDFIYSSLNQVLRREGPSLTDLQRLQPTKQPSYGHFSKQEKRRGTVSQTAEKRSTYLTEVVESQRHDSNVSDQPTSVKANTNRSLSANRPDQYRTNSREYYFRQIGNVLVVDKNEQVLLIDIKKFLRQACTIDLRDEQLSGVVRSKALLFPYRIQNKGLSFEIFLKFSRLLKELGIVLDRNENNDWFLKQMPSLLSVQDLDGFIEEMEQILRQEDKPAKVLIELLAKYNYQPTEVEVSEEWFSIIEHPAFDGAVKNLSEVDLLNIIHGTN